MTAANMENEELRVFPVTAAVVPADKSNKSSH